MSDVRFFKYYYGGSIAVPIVISKTQSMIVEPYSYFTIPVSAQSELSKITERGPVRFVSQVANPVKEAKSISLVQRQSQQHNVPAQSPPQRQPVVINTRVKPPVREEVRGEKQRAPHRVSVMQTIPTAAIPHTPLSRAIVEDNSPSGAEPVRDLPPVELVISSTIERTSNELRKETGVVREVIPIEKLELGVDSEGKNGEDKEETSEAVDDIQDEVADSGEGVPVEQKVAPKKKPARRKRASKKSNKKNK